MKEAYLPKQETLLTEIRNWKNTENLCKGIYDDEALKSRSFLKLKMQTYQQLYRKYNGASLSLDEQALHRMLRYHYKKIENGLYPNLLVRMGRRAWTALTVKLEGLVKGDLNQETLNAAKFESLIAPNGSVNKVESSIAKEQEQKTEHVKLPEGWWANDLGRKDQKRDKEQQLDLH